MARCVPVLAVQLGEQERLLKQPEIASTALDCPATLPNSFINSRDLPLCYSHRFSSYIIIQSGNNDTFIPSSPALSFTSVFAHAAWLIRLPEQWQLELLVVGTRGLAPVLGADRGSSQQCLS